MSKDLFTQHNKHLPVAPTRRSSLLSLDTDGRGIS